MGRPILVKESSATPFAADLVSRVRSGDIAALGELYDRHAPALYSLARRLLANDSDAEDVVHDVFLGLPEALRHYSERGALPAWLKRLTARVAINRMRATKRRGEETLVREPSTGNASLLDAIAVRDAVAGLPDSLRSVFVLKEIEGFTHEEIGALLNISRGASEVRLHRAIRALRTALETRT